MMYSLKHTPLHPYKSGSGGGGGRFPKFKERRMV